MDGNTEQLNRQALLDLTNRAKGGIAIYFLAWLLITLPFNYPSQHAVFFYVNTGVFGLLFISRVSHIIAFKKGLPLSVAASTNWLVVSILIAGLHWGLVTAWSLYDDSLADIRFFLVIVMATLAIAGTTALSISSVVRNYYPMFVLLPLIIGALYSGGTQNLVLAAMGALSLVYVFFTARTSHQDYWLAITNQALALEHAARMEELSITDQLTGLKNRAYFDQRYSEEWKRNDRQKTPVSMLMLDLDHFKQLNDTYGHAFGDHCLRKVGDVLRDEIKREIDIVARYGGEEFVVLLPDSGASVAQMIAERLRLAIADLELLQDGNASKVTCSIGGATAIPDYRANREELLKLADQALYQAKQDGRNCYRASEVDQLKQVG